MNPQATQPSSPATSAVHRDPTGRILVVAPCRNEEQYMRRTLDAVLGQTLPPACLVVVDDGSTDATPAILAEYAAQHPSLRVVRREDRGRRSVGPGVIDAFYAGLTGVDLEEFEFVCKLDLDLDLPKDYFRILVERMRADPRLGSCSGKPFYLDAAGERQPEWCDSEIVVGMTKFYRVTCFLEIGGFVREVMWDGIDSHRCRMLGWLARSFDTPELHFLHLRPMGSSDRSILLGRRRHGHGQYFMGTAPSYLLASVLRRLVQPPLLIGAMMIAWGYLWSWLRRVPRYEDMDFRRFLRRYQRRALLLGKRRAIESIEQEQAKVWSGRARSG
jgi:glycosyltransferase involved in cell wall biosynthesis